MYLDLSNDAQVMMTYYHANIASFITLSITTEIYKNIKNKMEIAQKDQKMFHHQFHPVIPSQQGDESGCEADMAEGSVEDDNSEMLGPTAPSVHQTPAPPNSNDIKDEVSVKQIK
ncbi:hypothetical protein WA026_022001 [Henosepilachna vigintioctopunctata]|uniref:Uncharacterized protein n=1 Tax=Henosepilachna vigintioctopunctata TaxID=420089 RepID=A0AAW1V3M9_9CUCU